MKRIILAALVGVLVSGPAWGAELAPDFHWRCPVKTKKVCNKSGCSNVPPVITIEIDCAKSLYSRCDAEGCDSYIAECQTSGDFLIINPTPSTQFKADLDGSAFVDTATLWWGVYVSRGQCVPL